ncbi:NAD(P)-binding protein [Aspergillus sclerotiicarbonarius CBS 121057]|uniref:NAD(P)-binding protein n=1 Tax=Aspergillus sclerotiicarbonarius (strain CBS 121057 / IBT 28362) TaxID=1448318 RepID=A0A319EQG0_ASPSB|nr:NAD(P)-binding protein [Aspergillus sclerotiicarbonarius CBS 121057]
MSQPQGKLVLLTGATGHVGHAVLLRALEAGYQMRITVRESSQAGPIRQSVADKDHDLNQLSFTTIPDLTEPGVFDNALQGVTHIIHIASPLARPSCTDFNRDIIAPSVDGTANLLSSALQHPTIQRIIITSSTSAIVDITDLSQSPAPPIPPTHRHPNYPPEFITTSEHAYVAAKTAALNLTDAFRTQQSPHFEIINLLPGYVFGSKGLATSPKQVISGSNVFGIGLAMRKGSWRDLVIEAMSCHVDDLADAHVNALDQRVPGNQDFILSVPFEPGAVREIVRERFPEAVGEGGVLVGGDESYRWFHLSYDVTNSEKVLLQREMKGIEEQIVDTARQVLDLAGRQ